MCDESLCTEVKTTAGGAALRRPPLLTLTREVEEVETTDSRL